MTQTSTNTSKKVLSHFSFGGGKDRAEKANKPAEISTSPTDNDNGQLSSPINSPSEGDEEPYSFCENGETDIFERSVQEPSSGLDNKQLPKCNRCHSSRSRSCTHNSSISLHSGHFLKNEDCIPPALDASTSLLNNKDTNLDEVEMVYSTRRNSSVIGLNMALGRPFTPSRKNSAYSINQSFQQAQQCGQPNCPGMTSTASQVSSPVSPPKLVSSKSSLNFCSFADVMNNEEYSRRPSMKSSISSGVVPKNSNQLPFTKTPLTLSNQRSNTIVSQLSRQLSHRDHNPNGSFMISPESSDSEEGERHSLRSKSKSISSTRSRSFPCNDNESFVSSSVGDCLRQSTTEIVGS